MDNVAEQLYKLEYYYKLERDVGREKAYRKAAEAVHGLPITSGEEARAIKGIGPSIATDINYFLQDGYIPRLRTLEEKYREQKAILDLFTSYYGIGTVTAIKYYNQGLRTKEDLWNRGNLTLAQKLGFVYHDQIEQKIPRGEMILIEKEIRARLGNVKLEIAGSYRRDEPFSGDVDVLVTGPVTIEQIVISLGKLLVGHLGKGPDMYRGIVKLGATAHRIDIRLIAPESFSYALLYFTGPKSFEIRLRRHANELGLRLNEYGLYQGSVSFPAASEADIFNLLGISYLTPEQRTNVVQLIRK